MDMNEALLETYRQYWPGLLEILNRPHIRESRVSCPLLLAVPPDYAQSRCRLMVIGQQTRGWAAPRGNTIESLQENYTRFHLGEHLLRTPFWQACHKLACLLNGDGPRYDFLWSNLVRVDQDGQRPDVIIEDEIGRAFPVLPREIEVTRPDTIIFFTGPLYDTRLMNTFPELEMVKIPGYRLTALARLVHPGLPHHAYRTHDPSYLRRAARPTLDSIIATLGALATTKGDQG
jgi:hypothetical protein